MSILALLLAACSPAADPQGVRPARADVRGFLYRDAEGLRVLTVATEVVQPISQAGTLRVGATFDDIHFEPVDVTSSASIRVDDGEPNLVEQRYELRAGYQAALGSRTQPVTLQGSARLSTEPDYLSLSGQLGGSVALFQQNTTLSASLGAGHDVIEPNRPLHPDDVGRWPDAHDQLSLSASVLQLASPRLALSAGGAFTWQWGALSSPYRRVEVLSGMGVLADYRPEAERHPSRRGRATCYLGAAWYLGLDMALHARLGGYFDTWGVKAVVPELRLVGEPHPRLLVSLGYRLYWQGPASFYQVRYDDLETTRTGDRRLGRIGEHNGSAELRWTFVGEPERRGAVDLVTAYQLSRLTYRDLLLLDPIVAHVGSLGVSIHY